MKGHFDFLADHIVTSLPPSIHERKTLLGALLELLPEDYHRRYEIMKMLEALQIHETAQLKFNLKGDGK